MTKPAICNNDEKQPAVAEFCDFGNWEVPVNQLSEIKQPNRDHAYILPDNSVWVLAYDGKSFTPINSGDGNGHTQPTQITNSDGYLKISGSGTYHVTTDLNTEKLMEVVKENIEIPKVTIATSKKVGVVKPDNRTITIDKEGTLTAVFPEAPLDGNTYARQDGKWVKNFVYPNVYHELSTLIDNQLTFNIAIKGETKDYKVMFANKEVALTQFATSIGGQVLFDRTSTEKAKTAIQFYYIKDGINELFYTLDLKPLFKLQATKPEENPKYIDKSPAVTVGGTEYFAIKDKSIIKHGQTVFFSLSLTSIKAFSFSRNAKLKIGKVSDPELFPRIRMAVNMVTENLSTAVYANTALFIETNGDIVLVNTADVSIGSTFNFRVGNMHFINMTYVTL